MTQNEFSAQRGLRLSTLSSWVHRLRRRRARKAQAVRLLPVEVASIAQESLVLLEVVLASGARLRFPRGPMSTTWPGSSPPWAGEACSRFPRPCAWYWPPRRWTCASRLKASWRW
ncbi:IS66 family insertion sequence element accessory protein TnpA [Myxococcus stipitatus]|uniref:IS66 family insertion sequence element accessory protein TnpA n=1 Tax=Myxococcus stipitatus TaxID=83455 RepID=UPI003B8312D6